MTFYFKQIFILLEFNFISFSFIFFLVYRKFSLLFAQVLMQYFLMADIKFLSSLFVQLYSVHFLFFLNFTHFFPLDFLPFIKVLSVIRKIMCFSILFACRFYFFFYSFFYLFFINYQKTLRNTSFVLVL